LRKKQPSASDLVTEQLLAHNLFLEAKLEDLVAALMSREHIGVTSRHKRTPQGKAREKKRTMFRAVSKGWRVGVFSIRELLHRSIDGFPKPKHKSFPSQKEAKKWLAAQLVETVTSDDNEGSSEEGDEPSAGDSAPEPESSNSSDSEETPPSDKHHRKAKSPDKQLYSTSVDFTAMTKKEA
jgi:hypothetical protein